MADKTLTQKQKRFCDEYVIDLNAKQAAIRAGYSEKGAKENASRMLTYANVKEEVKKLQSEVGIRNEITADFVLNGIKDIALDGEQETNRLRAFEMLGKYAGIYEKDNEQKKTEINPEWTVTIKKSENE